MQKTDSIDVLTPQLGKRRTLRQRLGLPRDALFGYILLMPSLFLIFALIGYPFLNSIWLSLHDKRVGVQNPDFIGLENYSSLLSDPDFINAIRNVMIYAFVAVFFKLVIGLIVAIIINEPMPMRGVIRAIILLPWAMPTLVTVLTWRWMYHDLYGVLNYIFLQAYIIDQPIVWLGTREMAMPAVIVVNVWRGFPFFAIMLLAGLQSIPLDLHEAAKVDGATVIQRFRHVTLPGVAPVMAVVGVLSTIWTFNDFTIVWLLTGGGPANATEVISTLTYKIAISGQQLGKGVAVSVIMMPLLMLFIVLLTRLTARQEAAS